MGKKVTSFGYDQTDVVEEFVNAVFKNENFDDRSIKRLTRRLSNEGIRLSHWKYF